MPDVQLAIRNATVEDTDAWNLTRLGGAGFPCSPF